MGVDSLSHLYIYIPNFLLLILHMWASCGSNPLFLANGSQILTALPFIWDSGS